MKKIYLCALLFIQISTAFAQSTLTNLVDSLPGNGFDIIESFNNKLYTYPGFRGGQLSEVDQNTGVLTPLFTIPVLQAPWSYTTYSGNFVYIKGKTIQTMQNSAAPESYIISAGAQGVDTLLSNMTPFGTIKAVDTMAYLVFSAPGSQGMSLYSCDLISPVRLIDSGLSLGTKANNNELFYIKSHYPVVYDQVMIRTNGNSKWQVDSVVGANYAMTLLGSLNGDMYYTISHRSLSMDTTWIKKCNAAGTVSVVDTIMMNAAVFDNGLTGPGSKLIIPFKHESAPYYTDLVMYDISNNTKLNITQNAYGVNATHLEQTQVAANHFYFNTISPENRYISDGTVAGTKIYGTQAGGFGVGLEFEDYSTIHTLGNKASICAEYPSAGYNDEFYYGSDTGLVMFKLFPVEKSYPSHFNKIGNNTFFRIHDAGYTKLSIIKMTDCGAPTNNPLKIEETLMSGNEIYPNPTIDGVFNVTLNSTQQTNFRLTDCYGAPVPFTTQWLNSQTAQVSMQRPAAGVYILQVQQDSKKQFAKVIVR